MIDTRTASRSTAAHSLSAITRAGKGFTLIEVAIALFITTLVLGAGLAALNAQIENQRIAATKTKAGAIQTALTSFLSRNYRLPCPADPTIASGTTSYGVEVSPTGTCNSLPGVVTSGTAPATVVTGMVPWKTLGLSDDSAYDGYNDRFKYQVVLSATGLNAQTVSGMRGYIILASSGPGAPGAPPTGNQINDCSAGLTFNPCADVAVILSYGKDGYGAYTAAGTQTSSTGAGPDELENINNDNIFVVKDSSDNPTNPFDDILLALTPNDLLSPLITQGALQNYNAVLNNNFTIIKGAIIAYATSNRTVAATCTGTCPTIPTSPPCYSTGQCPVINYPIPPNPLATLPSSVTKDPWGNNITYTVTTPSVNASTPPQNVAYTLSSYGPDGVAGTSDDIVVNVLAGELQTMFAKTGM